MSEPSEYGAVFWSSAAHQFYQEGRQGAIPRLEAMEHLSYRETPTGTRLIDERGAFVPSIPNLIPESFSNQYVDRLRDASLTTKNVYETRAGKSSYYATVATYEDANGKLHVIEKFFAGGRAINDEVENRKLIAQIASEMFPDSDSGHSGEAQDALRAMFHYEVS